MTLPLGSYHIAETKPPYGYAGTDAAYDVTLVWDNQTQEIVAADAVEFHNEREKAKVGIYKTDLECGKYLAGACLTCTRRYIHDADGTLFFSAGELIATSPRNQCGWVHLLLPVIFPFAVNSTAAAPTRMPPPTAASISLRKSALRWGYYVNEEPMEVTFTYDGQAVQSGKHLHQQTYRNVGKQSAI